MNVKTLLNIGYKKCNNKNDVRDLLCFIMDSRFEELIMNYDEHVSENIEKRFVSNVEKLKEGYPLAYIKGEKEFYGRRFMVSTDTLIPREETEMIIDLALKEKHDSVLDLCTGSGIIGITMKLEGSNKVMLSDISEGALKIAKTNSKELCAEVDIVKSDLFDSIVGTFDLIISNPPYIKKSELEGLEMLKSEPYEALYGGEDGLYFYNKILREAKDYLNLNGRIIFEIGYDQMQEVKALALKYGYIVEGEYKDIFGLDRFIKVVK